MSDSTLTPPAPVRVERPAPRSWGAWLNSAVADPALVPFWLTLIVILGALFRFTGLQWDQGIHHHPDERFLDSVVNDVQWPTSIGQYFDEANSPLNPRNVGKTFWVYGDLPLTLVKGTAVLLDRLDPGSGLSWQSYDRVELVGRALNGLFDLGTLLLLFLTARRLYKDQRIALLAALLYSMAVLPIQHSHFWVVDNMATFFVALTIYWLARIWDTEGSGRLVDYGLAGLFFGMALASKVSVATLALIFAAVGAAKLYRAWRAEGDLSQPLLEGMILRLGVAALVGLFAFRIFMPYAFSGPLTPSPRWISNLQEVRGQISGEADPPWGFQWAGRVRLLFPWKNMVLWGLGLPLGLAAWIGWAAAAWRLVRRQEWAHLIPVLWVAVLFLHQGNQWVMSMRYLLPLYPMAVLLAAWGLIGLWQKGTQRAHELRRGGLLAMTPRRAGALMALVVGGTLIYAVGFMNIYTRPHTAIQATQWLAANAVPGSVIATESYDEGLPPTVSGATIADGRFQLGITYTDGNGTVRHDGQVPMYNGDNPQKLDDILRWLDEVDYMVMVSNRLYGSVARLPARYPLTNNYYDALFDGSLGWELAAEITEGPKLFGLIELDDQYSRSGPGLFGLDWDTWLAAEEAFSVYDHPRVTIFRKTEAYDRERAAQRLMEGVDWNNLSSLTAKQWTEQGGSSGATLRLTAAERAEYERAGSWSALFDRNGLANRFPLLPWLLALELLGLLALPYLAVVGRGLPDRGLVLAKGLGLLLVTFVIWWLASLRLVTFSLGGIALAMLLVGAGGALLAGRWWQRPQALRRLGPALLRAELIFWLPFLLVLAIRWANPDLWHPAMGGEKPMDFSYLNAVVKSVYFPPMDPWFAGGYINYYYYGFVLAATLIKLTGVMPSIAYNLLVPTFFGMLATGVWSVALALASPLALPRRAAPPPSVPTGGARVYTRPGSVGRPAAAPQPKRYAIAALAVLMVCILGNLAELRVLAVDIFAPAAPQGLDPAGETLLTTSVRAAQGFAQWVSNGGPQSGTLPGRQEWAYWNASRAIQSATGEGTINEMPWFTFLYADLHAHLMALPLTALLLALALAWLRAPRERSMGATALTLGLMALVLGALWPTNTWDMPTYALVAFAALGLREWARDGRLTLRALLQTLFYWLLLMVLARLLYQPYHAAYQAGYTAVERWHGSRTGLGDYLWIHGLFLFIFAVALITDWRYGTGHNSAIRMARQSLRHLGRRQRLATLRRQLVAPHPAHYLLGISAALGLVGLLLIPLGWAVPGLNLILVALLLPLLLRDRPQPLWQMALSLMLVGLGLTTMVELIVLKGDIGRMNTVFKFYLQVWLLWGVAAAVAAGYVERLLRGHTVGHALWRMGVVPLLLISMLYPLFSTYAKVNDRFDRSVGPGLDGAAFLEKASYSSPGPYPLTFEMKWEAAAFRWIEDNLPGSPTMAEIANGDHYRWATRYAMFTGNPAIVGWDWHQRQQRGSMAEQVMMRQADVLELYGTPEAARAHELLTRYGAAYVIVGPLERAYADPAGIAKFEPARGVYWDLVYENQEVRIYRLLP